ncbi:MAG: bifunctional folylpolyglutamate synthase/dihydrofolate synthase [Clostridiales bacterium]|nr:bifunctional folylpolyglutamate synthase/dihydrofolate synthase [Clostridiales bacterium]
MNYEEAMSFLKDTEKYGSRLGLDSIRSLMRELGDIQEKIPIIHIAGTNGKGSVGAMLSSVLAESGYRVGRFNTPDVFSYEEEFLMNGIPIEKECLARLFTEVSGACGRMTERGLPHPTRFEVETAAAFLWFYEERFDIALVEAGLGGETDATNLINKPLVSVLTSISMDHMSFLGNTLSEIAAAKAGIIKRGCPVVSVAQKPEAMEIIREKCRREGAELFLADEKAADNPSFTDGELSFLWDMSVFCVDARLADRKFRDASARARSTRRAEPVAGDAFVQYAGITPGLRGRFQLENAVCALRVLELLKGKYPAISGSSVASGLRMTRWPGRFEQIASLPDVFLDGAHNEDAAAKLRDTLDLYFAGRRVIYIMGVLADKEYEKMIRFMFREGDRVYTLTPPNPRALSAADLATQLKKQKIDAIPCVNPRDAVSYALADAKEEDVILAFGSLSYLRGVREAFREISGKQ